MKKSYKKIAIIVSFFFFFLVLNLINFKIDNYYYLLIPIIFFIGLIVINCGYEKKRFDKEKDIILTLIISIIGYLLITYILGLKTGFTTNTYNLSFISIILNIIPVILFIITSEVFRYSVLRKGSGSKIILVLINIVLVLLDLSIYVNYLDLGSSGILKLVVLILIPSVSKNIFLSYLTIKSGIYPSIVYRFFMELKTYIVPIFPDFGMYLDSILNVLFPIFCLFITYKEFNRKKESKIRRYEGNRYFNIIWIIILFIVFITIMLSSGLFRYSLFSIGSNSMEPNINKGDIIIIERIDIDNVNDLKKGDVILFRSGSMIISHRIIKIVDKAGIKYYYTKGDNNEVMDLYPVVKEDIVGISKFRLRFLGWPSVFLNELLSKR